ncbi:MAG: (2Fe-2S)-binding protein [Alphaproteobacteria bacterium]|nr:MAG: (2Fe-2S)-binding protein [Alphaproteobacteria bacterium]
MAEGTTALAFTVNGQRHELAVPAHRLLVETLREDLGLTGTHVGCDTSQCGACVVLVDGRPVKSCTMLAAEADGAEIVTIEGLARKESDDTVVFHPMQEAFRDCHGLQCGFCTPGMVMQAIAIVESADGPLDEETVRHALEGNLCRCTGYQNIVKAVLEGARRMGRPVMAPAEEVV